FPAWTDTAQVNTFLPEVRAANIAVLNDIAAQADGVRCDMAMLLVTRIFASTWGARAGQKPDKEFWWEVIRAVKGANPDFLFMAEAYWSMEWELQMQGFDYCYDKRLYDRLGNATAEEINTHLSADITYQSHLVRFIENHDEPRAATTFGKDRAYISAVTAYTLPGARLFHEGQFEGWRVRLPVQLGRRCAESVNEPLHAFYHKLLDTLALPIFHDGTWQLCTCYGWPDNNSYENLLVWCWWHEDARWVMAVNYAAMPAQGMIHLPWGDLAGRQWTFTDLLGGDSYTRDGDELDERGLYVGLGAWGVHVFQVG
ncbi:MAG: alpha-amylase, partial [Anaerolineae bacterium]|nr:alpha-amylase [Anaerolineae bacterium]